MTARPCTTKGKSDMKTSGCAYAPDLLEITRMAPGDQSLTVEYAYGGETNDETVWKAELRRYPDGPAAPGESVRNVPFPGPHARVLTLRHLENGVTYGIRLLGEAGASGRPLCRSRERFFRTGFAPGCVVNYIHPEDTAYEPSGRSPASPSVARLPGGRLVVSHDVFWGGAAQDLSKVFGSDDNGETWFYLADLCPCFWGKLFVHRGTLYMLANRTEYGDLEIFRSTDGGHNWDGPAVILPGGGQKTGGPHKAPMPVVEHAGRLWTGIDFGSWALGGHASGCASIASDADLMDGASWTVTPFLPYDPHWPGAVRGGDQPGLLEGNIVEAPDGGLVNFLRYNTIGGTPDYGRAVMLRVDTARPGTRLSFERTVNFPGNMSKFTIRRNAADGRYYALVNRVTQKDVRQRNILSLSISDDLIHWEIRRDFLNYEDNGWPEDRTQVGFQYVDWIFDGDNDILAASRTALNGAYNYHNANYITFHRFRNFRA